MLKQSKIDGERRIFQDRSVCLHNTEKSFLCVRFARKQHRVFLQYYRLVRDMLNVKLTPTPSQSPIIPSVYRLVRDTKCQTSQSPNAAANQLDIF